MLLVVSLIFLAQTVFAEDPAPTPNLSPESSNSKVTIIADISIRDFQIISQEKNKFNLSFSVENAMEIQSNLIYGVELIKKVDEDKVVFSDSKTYLEDKITVTKETPVKREITYQAPNFLSGEYELWLKIKDESGMVFSLRSLNVTLSGTNNFVELSNPCYLTIEGETEKYNLIQGVDLKPEEKIFLECQAQNKSSEKVSVNPRFELYTRDSFSSQKQIGNIAQDVFEFNPRESKLIKIPLVLSSQPQAYDVKTELMKKNGSGYVLFSNPIFSHLVIVGKSATINSADLDKDFYQKGETAKISYLISASADGFRDSRHGGSNLQEPILKVEMKNQAGQLCAAKIEEKNPNFQDKTTLNLVITQDCLDPQVTLELFDGPTKLYEKKLNVTTNVKEGIKTTDAEKKSSKLFLNLFLVISGLLLLVILYLLIKKRKNSQIVGIFFFSLILSGGLLYSGNDTLAVNATLEKCRWLTKANGEAVDYNSYASVDKCSSWSNTSAYAHYNNSNGWVGWTLKNQSYSAAATELASLHLWLSSLYADGCNSTYLSAQKNLCQSIAGNKTGCSFFSEFDLPCDSSMLTSPLVSYNASVYTNYYSPYATYLCYCDTETVTYELSGGTNPIYGPSNTFQTTGTLTGTNMCNNGMTSYMEYNHNSAGYNSLVGSSSSPKNLTPSQSYFSGSKNLTAPVTPGTNYKVDFRFAFTHGLNMSMNSSSADDSDSGSIGYTVSGGGGCTPNCSCASDTCTGSTCSNGCGGTCSGTKNCSSVPITGCDGVCAKYLEPSSLNGVIRAGCSSGLGCLYEEYPSTWYEGEYIDNVWYAPPIKILWGNCRNPSCMDDTNCDCVSDCVSTGCPTECSNVCSGISCGKDNCGNACVGSKPCSHAPAINPVCDADGNISATWSTWDGKPSNYFDIRLDDALNNSCVGAAKTWCVPSCAYPFNCSPEYFSGSCSCDPGGDSVDVIKNWVSGSATSYNFTTSNGSRGLPGNTYRAWIHDRRYAPDYDYGNSQPNNYDSKSFTCPVAPTYSCGGTAPSVLNNGKECAGTKVSSLVSQANWELVFECPVDGGICKYTCAEGYIYDAGMCRQKMPGSCGNADGKTFCKDPSGTDLCDLGTASPVTFASNRWEWTCTNDGVTSGTCSARKECPWIETSN